MGWCVRFAGDVCMMLSQEHLGPLQGRKALVSYILASAVNCNIIANLFRRFDEMENSTMKVKLCGLPLCCRKHGVVRRCRAFNNGTKKASRVHMLWQNTAAVRKHFFQAHHLFVGEQIAMLHGSLVFFVAHDL